MCGLYPEDNQQQSTSAALRLNASCKQTTDHGDETSSENTISFALLDQSNAQTMTFVKQNSSGIGRKQPTEMLIM